MASNLNKYISVAYKLYTVEGEDEELVEEADHEHPFHFISGYGVALDAFEEKIAPLSTGDEFDFTLSKEEAYGDYEEEHVVSLKKDVFKINGHFDHDNIFEGAAIPLQNDEGNRFMGIVLEIGEDSVKVDLNHPLSGKDIRFVGHIVDSHKATPEEIQGLINRMNGEGCCCGCDHSECHKDEGTKDGCPHHDHNKDCCH